MFLAFRQANSVHVWDSAKHPSLIINADKIMSMMLQCNAKRCVLQVNALRSYIFINMEKNMNTEFVLFFLYSSASVSVSSGLVLFFFFHLTHLFSHVDNLSTIFFFLLFHSFGWDSSSKKQMKANNNKNNECIFGINHRLKIKTKSAN